MYSSYYSKHRESLHADEPQMFKGRMLKTYGAILSILAAATLSLGIANVVMTNQAYCDPWMDADPVYCSNINEPYVWTWVAPGIWASAPIFIAGLFAMCLGNDPSKWARIFAVLIFLSAIVFAPAMLILSSIEVWRGHASTWNFYKLNDKLSEGNIWVEDSPYQAKFALPLVITILAGIMFIMTGLITLVLCCCMKSMGMSTPKDSTSSIGHPIYQPTPSDIQTKEKDVYYPPRGEIKTAGDYQPTTGPHMATRYNSGCETHSSGSSGAMFGNFPSRAFTPGAPVHNLVDSNSEYRFK